MPLRTEAGRLALFVLAGGALVAGGLGLSRLDPPVLRATLPAMKLHDDDGPRPPGNHGPTLNYLTADCREVILWEGRRGPKGMRVCIDLFERVYTGLRWARLAPPDRPCDPGAARFDCPEVAA
jgi:hypothetical protein